MVEKETGVAKKGLNFLRSLPYSFGQEVVNIARYGLRAVAAVAWEIRGSFGLEPPLHVEKVSGNVAGDVLKLWHFPPGIEGRAFPLLRWDL